MADDLMRYDLLVQDALRGVVRKVLGDAARDGLPGEHHFYISFRTDHAGVKISSRLREKYPADMTIVLQHQFWELSVGDGLFEVGLSFSGVPERLIVPYAAVTGFFDPSVQFGLKFELDETAEGEAVTGPVKGPRGAASEPAETNPKRTGSGVPKLMPVAATTAEKPRRAPKEVVSKDIAAKDASVKEISAKEPKGPSPTKEPAREDAGAEVVSLDAFRKKS